MSGDHFEWYSSLSCWRVVDESTMFANKIEADKPKPSAEKDMADKLRALQRNQQNHAAAAARRIQQEGADKLAQLANEMQAKLQIEQENSTKQVRDERRKAKEAQRLLLVEQVSAERSRLERVSQIEQLEEANRRRQEEADRARIQNESLIQQVEEFRRQAERRDAELRQMELQVRIADARFATTSVHLQAPEVAAAVHLQPPEVVQRKRAPQDDVARYLNQDSDEDQFVDSQSHEEDEDDDSASVEIAEAARAHGQRALDKASLQEASRFAETERTVVRKHSRSKSHVSAENRKVAYISKSPDSPTKRAFAVVED